MAVNLPEAPQLNLSNPSVEAASGFASAAAHNYAAGMQFASALREADLRNRQAQEAAKQKQASDYALEVSRLNTIGARPLRQEELYGVNSGPNTGIPPSAPQPDEQVLNTAPADTPTFRSNPDGTTSLAPSRAPINPDQVQRDSRGQPWLVPSLADREQAKQSGIVPKGPLLDNLNRIGAAPKPGQVLPWADLHSLMTAAGLAEPPAETFTDDTEHFTQNGQPVTVQRGNRGTMRVVPPPEGVTQNPQTSRADSQTILPDRVGPNGGPLVYDRNTQKIVEIPLPAGAKTQLNPAQQAAMDARNAAAQTRADARSDAAEARAQQGRNAAQNTIDALQVKEQAQHALRAAYGAALTAQPTDESGKPDPKGKIHVIDPVTKKEEFLNPARRAAYENEYNKATALAQTYHDAQQKIIAAHGGQTGDATAPAGAPKAASLADIQSYAQRKGVSRAQAVREFQQFGYKVGQ
jgi:hypothetical protein